MSCTQILGSDEGFSHRCGALLTSHAYRAVHLLRRGLRHGFGITEWYAKLGMFTGQVSQVRNSHRRLRG